MTIGHSRVPVYSGEKTNIIGLVLVKNLFMVDSKAAVPLRKMIIRKIPRVSENMPLYDILNEFQKGHSHIAVVYRDLNDKNKAPKKVNDGEQLDLKDNCKNKLENMTLDKGAKLESRDTTVTKIDGAQQAKKSPPATPAFKKRHRGCSFCILDIDNAPLPVFPPNEVVVGVITMEDVIEELLQEEILDETDEYVNIHNKIKVNMNASKGKAPDANLLHPSQAVQGHTPTNSISTATSATGSPTTIDQISESESLRNQ
ncbi:DUF21 domain-containing protein [Spatholobus suberectus]|nr:DUF21 domain-containing protein [Spatholobus suberectus]TKY75150.1 DUF21 domain-containing protein [Spatholobus suberectus]